MVKQKLTSFSLLLFLLLFGCTNQSQKNSPAVDSTDIEPRVESKSQNNIGRTNYAVIWTWATNDVELVSNYSSQISKELSNLWKDDIVENAYYNADSKVDKLDHFPNIMFFIKAQNEVEAKSILNKLTVVTKEIATYKLRSVGQLWLERKTDLINRKGITKSFATVWTTTPPPFEGERADILLKSQSDTILKLWNEGLIENVYFDIEGTYNSNTKTDFVFFINSTTEIEANAICKSLPFCQEKIATYEIHPVGVFWMGKYQSN